jgi:hypothetical protein
MSESKLSVQPAQTFKEQQPDAPEARKPELRQLTELELMLTGGGEIITPWP